MKHQIEILCAEKGQFLSEKMKENRLLRSKRLKSNIQQKL